MIIKSAGATFVKLKNTNFYAKVICEHFEIDGSSTYDIEFKSGDILENVTTSVFDEVSHEEYLVSRVINS